MAQWSELSPLTNVACVQVQNYSMSHVKGFSPAPPVFPLLKNLDLLFDKS